MILAFFNSVCLSIVMKKLYVSFLKNYLQTSNMQLSGSLSVLFNDQIKMCSSFNNWFFSSYHSTVVLYIIRIWCYPMISHNYSTQGTHHSNVVPTTSSYLKIFSILPSYECINFLGYISLSWFHWMQVTMKTQALFIVNYIVSVFCRYFFVLVLSGKLVFIRYFSWSHHN